MDLKAGALDGLQHVARTVRAFRHRNYRLFFAGQGISLVGTWMQRVALGWLVYKLTGSQWLLGVVSFSNQIPLFLGGPLAGVMADRLDRRRLLVVLQVLAMAQALALAALTLRGVVTAWHIVALGVVLGAINAFDMPVRQSFVVELVEDRADLPNAIALNSFMFNGARLIGPCAAGLLVASLGEGLCFLLNGVSFLAVIAAYAAMRITRREDAPRPSGVWSSLREGAAYVFRTAPIRSILTLLAVVSVLGMPYLVLLPVFARDILGGGPRTLGWLMASPALGAGVGALFVASRSSVRAGIRHITLSTTVFGAALIAFAGSRNLLLSIALLGAAGFGIMVQMACCNTLLQTIAEDDKRGRVMSFYMMAFGGVAPVGSLLAGALAERIGAPWTIAAGGFGCLLAAAAFTLKLPVLDAALRAKDASF